MRCAQTHAKSQSHLSVYFATSKSQALHTLCTASKSQAGASIISIPIFNQWVVDMFLTTCFICTPPNQKVNSSDLDLESKKLIPGQLISSALLGVPL